MRKHRKKSNNKREKLIAILEKNYLMDNVVDIHDDVIHTLIGVFTETKTGFQFDVGYTLLEENTGLVFICMYIIYELGKNNIKIDFTYGHNLLIDKNGEVISVIFEEDLFKLIAESNCTRDEAWNTIVKQIEEGEYLSDEIDIDNALRIKDYIGKLH